MDMELSVDKTKCVHCGLCIKDCIANALEFNEDQIPIPSAEAQKCYQCQHCLAICPTGALSILGKNPNNSELLECNIDANEVLNLIKLRRSNRHYKNENISANHLAKLKEILSYIPTGLNYRGLHFSIIDDAEVMDKFRNKVHAKIKIAFSNILIKAAMKKIYEFVAPVLSGEDSIFRGAPHMIVVSVDKKSPSKNVDPIIALSYFELFAQSLGVKTCWCGIGYYCLELIPELVGQFEIPNTHKISYVMVFGYSQREYARVTQPDQATIISVKDAPEKKMPWFKKVKKLLSVLYSAN